MKRREMFLLFGAAAVLAPATTTMTKAQERQPVRPTRQEVAEALTDENTFAAVLVGMDALRINLLLTKSSFFEAHAAAREQLSSYESMKNKAVEGALKLRGAIVEASSDLMPALAPGLQAPVDNAVTILIANGLEPNSLLLRKQVTALWTFLYTLSESGQESVENIVNWICGSNPFDALCG